MNKPKTMNTDTSWANSPIHQMIEDFESPTPETDDATLRAMDIEGCGEFDAVHVQVAKRLERERDEAREYADKLVAHKDMVCLPKDLEVLREANLGLAVELNEAQNEILGWKNKWDCAIEMGARAECERDEMTLRRNLAISLLDEECALADRLGTELEIALSRPCPRSGESIKALTAWKEARK